ncbi:MAG: ATP synthase F0 subunit B [Clostridiales bacterium]|nr:ATP synthase F0 subunit B [Clostridiales bacterium]
MTQFLCDNILEVFGLDWKSMLFYVVNFLILLAALIGLLYKPVKNMLKKKRESLDDVYAENEKLKAENAAREAEYQRKTEELKLENARIAANAAEAAQQKADALIADAQEQAKSIVAAAKKESATQMEQLKGEYRNSVNNVAVQVAQKLLEREITESDNDALIEQVLSDWEND